MFGTQNLTLFIISSILLNLTPGQDTFYIIGRSVAQGKRAGVLSVLGITSGSFVHTFAAAFGLSAVLATSTSAFVAVKLIGAAYLTYLGARMILDRSVKTGPPPEFVKEHAWVIFRAGLFTSLLNPKVALFFMAFLPQFVDPVANSKIPAFLFLGGLFICTGTIWCFVLAYFASAMSRRRRDNPSAGLVIRRATGTIFVGLGMRLAAAK